jgi:putative ABC transport system permease protein
MWISLALGIGANSAVFSLVDAVLFKPLNVGNPSRLVSVYTRHYSGAQYSASSYADFIDFRNKTDVFENLAAFTEMFTMLRSGNQSERAYGLLVSPNYFDYSALKPPLAAPSRPKKIKHPACSSSQVLAKSVRGRSCPRWKNSHLK